jgi:DNA-binding MarR family transcriptional regulator
MSRARKTPSRRTSKALPDAAELLPLPCACANIRRLSRLVTRLYDAELRDSELEVTQFGVLSALNRLGKATHGQLARGFGMDSTTMTRVVAVLERRGWVVRRAGTDRRQRIYQITREGRRQLDGARAGWRRAQDRLATILGAQALAALTDATTRMRAAR